MPLQKLENKRVQRRLLEKSLSPKSVGSMNNLYRHSEIPWLKGDITLSL